MLVTYKFRLYPNKEQEKQISKTFGCCRFVYNNILSYRQEMYEKENKSLSKVDCNNYCNRVLKSKYVWLREVDKFALTNSIYNMDNAYKKFFKENAGYPKYKSKRNNYKSYTTNYTNGNIEVDFDNNKIKLPKLKYVKVKLHRRFNGIIKNVTMSQVPSGKYYISILVDTLDIKKKPILNKKIGIDLGIKDLCITSDGEKYKNPKVLKKYEKKIARLNRSMARKKKGSNNFYKVKHKLAVCYEKISNIRCDYLHKVSHKIISENQVIITEDLQVKNMIKNHKLASSIADVSWYELTRQLAYKAQWYGRTYLKVNTFYASSQLCHKCGYQNSDMKNLQIRKWICPQCNTTHDRDVNAANNILQEGIRIMV